MSYQIKVPRKNIKFFPELFNFLQIELIVESIRSPSSIELLSILLKLRVRHNEILYVYKLRHGCEWSDFKHAIYSVNICANNACVLIELRHSSTT